MIISILGLSGKHESKETYAFYDAKIIDKQSGDYHNATHFLLENYPDERFFFLGTAKAIDFQKELLDFSGERTHFIEIEDNSLDDIFENVFKLISQAHTDEEILLDITHGFRHQPISAIFSATLHRFLHNGALKILFAKQIIERERYEYILLNQYIDITQLSLLLTGFIRTLNFVEGVQIEGFETIAFSNFSKALLSNDFYTLQTSYKNLLETVRRAKKDQKFDHLKDLFVQIEKALLVFKDFSDKPIYRQYLIVADLMYSKNYILLSLTYLFEALRFYCSDRFEKNSLTCKREKHKNNAYTINQEVITFITKSSFKSYYKPNCYDDKFHTLYDANRTKFLKITNVYDSLRRLRNNLTHVNSEEHSPDIKTKLEKQLTAVKKLIEDDILAELPLELSSDKPRVVKDFRKRS